MSGCVSRAIAWAIVTCLVALNSSCAHRLGPKDEPPRVARKLGLWPCTVSETMRRYEVLDFADLLGNPNLADSGEWATAMSKVQPGDRLRHVNCHATGDNYFGLFRGGKLIFRFGSMLND